MNDHTISRPTLQLLELIQSSVALRSMVERHPDLLSALMRAAARADQRGKSDTLIEVVARVACTSDRVEAIHAGNVIELAERMQTAARAITDLSDAFKKFFPAAIATSGAASSTAN